MKRFILAALVAAVSICANAQNTGLLGKKNIKAAAPIESYLQTGAVTEAGGKVVFSKSIKAQGKSRDAIYQALAQWASLRFMPSSEHGIWSDKDYYKNSEYSKVKTADKAQGIIVCTGNEEQVFSNRTLSKDFTNVAYTLTINFSDGQVEASISNISYIYNISADTTEKLAAEEWITDKEAITKKGTLNRKSGKFRVTTIDLKNQLFAEIENAIK